jgi:CheY-like chemotaxis protein
LRRMSELDFGVVVLDLRLPGKNGLEVLKEARAQGHSLRESYHGLPVGRNEGGGTRSGCCRLFAQALCS